MKKIAWATFVLVVLYLIFSNTEPYTRAADAITKTFASLWSALVTGK